MFKPGDQYEKYYTNEWGSMYWMNKQDNNIFAHLPYRWVYRLTILDESKGDKRVTGIINLRDFELEIHNWIPLNKEYFRKRKLEKLNLL